MAALIDEARCIGCALCIRACPTDAIVGAQKQMHTVLVEQCSGCELCLPPCPVDCIDMLPLAQRGSAAAQREAGTPVAAHAARWRERHRRHEERLAREREEHERGLAAAAQDQLAGPTPMSAGPDPDRKRAAVRVAIERARLRATGSA
jgi:electron transport complex protein RnfB